MTELSRRNLLRAAAVTGGAAGLGAIVARPAGGRPAATARRRPAAGQRQASTRWTTATRSSSTVRIRDGRFVASGATPSRARDAQGDRPARPHRRPRADREPHPLREPGQPARLPRRRESSWRPTSPRCWRCSAARRRDVPAGQFITAMGGWQSRMFAERRLPTLAELDTAVPDRPVFLSRAAAGRRVTNTLGKAFFESGRRSPAR